MRNRHGPRIPEVVYRPATFHAKKDHVVAIVDLGYVDRVGGQMTVGIRFLSPEHLLLFMAGLMERAAEVWPDDPLVKEYLIDS